jgi:exodeoxyribonuclease VII large subunit
LNRLDYSVSELCSEVRDRLRQSLAPAWVVGEVQRARRSQPGHLYFELVEKGQGDEIVGKLEAVIWRRDLRAIEQRLGDGQQELSEGLEIRCFGEVDFYPPFGRLQLVVRDVDPVFTAGLLSRRRQETLQALSAAGLLSRNKELRLSAVPLRIGLITSEGSAAYHDFLSTLGESGYAFRVLFVHSPVQGRDAERGVTSAAEAVAKARVDCLALVRGGGAKADLATFDSRRVAEALATAPIPVITGLGHEIDQAIADLVAHTACKTPTQAASFLVQRVGAAEQAIRELTTSLGHAALRPVARARTKLGHAQREARLGGYRLAAWKEQIANLEGLLARAAARRLDLDRHAARGVRQQLATASVRRIGRIGAHPPGLVRSIADRSWARLRERKAVVDGMARLCAQLAPERTLTRGFSITRDCRGRVVTAAGQVQAGDRISTQVASGQIGSVVEES